MVNYVCSFCNYILGTRKKARNHVKNKHHKEWIQSVSKDKKGKDTATPLSKLYYETPE